MRIPLSLIQSYIELDEPLPAICNALTLLGIEVEGIENEHAPFSRVCVAEIIHIEPHPSSKLTIVKIDDGKKHHQVVSAAKNCRIDLKIPYAKPGARLANNQVIEEVTLRGVASHGMLCSSRELGLPEEEEQLLELPNDWTNGTDLLPLLWDPVLDLSLTPNLGHCMSALGIARELSLAFQKPIRMSSLSALQEEEKNPIHVSLENPEECPRYFCHSIKGVENGPSPFWLRQTLLKAGMRPISAIVDVTNYLLLKTGQPLHVFDADKIEGDKITIRSAEKAEPFYGLDELLRTVPKGSLLICDENRPIALAGIMGSFDSAVSLSTKNIVIEAAVFDPLSVRKTSRTVGLRTESSQRFEKGIDREATSSVLEEACQLIVQLTGGHLTKGKIKLTGKDSPPQKIHLRTEKVNRVLGTNLSVGEVEEFIKRIGCTVLNREHNSFLLEIPSFRNDLTEEIDMVEEVARVYGYNNLERKTALYATSSLPHDPNYLFENEVRKRLAASGLQEILTCDLISPMLSELSPELLYPRQSLLKVCSAKSEEYSILRPSLLAGNLEVVRTNLDQKNLSVAAFEIGAVYIEGPKEVPMCSVVLSGMNRPHHWRQKPREWDFYDLKGIIELLLQALLVSQIEFRASSHPTFHPGRQVNLFHGDLLIGSLGEIHPAVLAKLDLKQRVIFAELSLQHLQKCANPTIRCKPLPLFPSTERDWTVTLPQKVRYEDLLAAINSLHQSLYRNNLKDRELDTDSSSYFGILEKVECIDLYERNVTLRFTYRDLLKTVAFEEAERAHEAAIAHITANLL